MDAAVPRMDGIVVVKLIGLKVSIDCNVVKNCSPGELVDAGGKSVVVVIIVAVLVILLFKSTGVSIRSFCVAESTGGAIASFELESDVSGAIDDAGGLAVVLLEVSIVMLSPIDTNGPSAATVDEVSFRDITEISGVGSVDAGAGVEGELDSGDNCALVVSEDTKPGALLDVASPLLLEVLADKSLTDGSIVVVDEKISFTTDCLVVLADSSDVTGVIVVVVVVVETDASEGSLDGGSLASSLLLFISASPSGCMAPEVAGSAIFSLDIVSPIGKLAFSDDAMVVASIIGGTLVDSN